MCKSQDPGKCNNKETETETKTNCDIDNPDQCEYGKFLISLSNLIVVHCFPNIKGCMCLVCPNIKSVCHSLTNIMKESSPVACNTQTKIANRTNNRQQD